MKYNIINANITNGLKYLKKLDTYGVLFIDDKNIYLKYKEEINELIADNFIIYISDKEELMDLKFMFINKHIKEIAYEDKYIYIFSSNPISLNFSEIYSSITDNTLKDLRNDDLLLFGFNNVYNDILPKILKQLKVTNKILDITTNEDISLSLLNCNSIIEDTYLTRLSTIFYKSELNGIIDNCLIKKINIYE